MFERGLSTDLLGVTEIESGRFIITGEGWHQMTLTVYDAQGSFKDTIHFRLDGAPQCSRPTADQSINICSPAADRITTSPIHVSAVANSSVPIRAVEIGIDNVRYYISQGFRAPAGGWENTLPDQQGTISAFIPVSPGPNTVTIKVIQTDNHTFTKKVTFTVAPFEECSR